MITARPSYRPDTVVAYDPQSDEDWTLDELIEHAIGCEDQIDYLWARIRQLEGELARRKVA